MTNTLCLEKSYSTTRMVIQADPTVFANEVKQSNNPNDKLETVLFLPEGEGRKGEGGLRTKGYFKKSFANKPLITVITVVFNGEKHLEQTIQSVISQTYKNVEYIIIDGGSTDGTLDIIKKYEEKIDYWVSEGDSGIYDAMNKGISLAMGEWIGLVNADDYLNSDSVEIVLRACYKNQNCMFLYGKLHYFDDNGYSKIIGKKIKSKLEMILFGRFNHPTCFIHKSVYQALGTFDTKYKIAADYEFGIRCWVNSVKFCFINSTISNFRLGGASSNLLKNQKERNQIRKKYLHIPIISDLLFYVIVVKNIERFKNETIF